MNRAILTGLSAAGVLLLTACSSTSHSSMSGSGPGHTMSGTQSTSPSVSGMGGMRMSSGDGLSTTVDGYTLKFAGTPRAGMAVDRSFTVAKDGQVVTAFDLEQTKRMHLYLIRSDLTGFQHLHPVMDPSGTWSVGPAALTPGSYRIYAQFVPHEDAAAGALVLSAALSVPGPGAKYMAPLPAAGSIAAADGYSVTVSGTPKAGKESELTLSVSKDGKPVADLQPYLDTYAHVTAIHAGDLALAHLHPDGPTAAGPGGPKLILHADLPHPGLYRVFIQFQTAGALHTAALTLTAS